MSDSNPPNQTDQGDAPETVNSSEDDTPETVNSSEDDAPEVVNSSDGDETSADSQEAISMDTVADITTQAEDLSLEGLDTRESE